MSMKSPLKTAGIEPATFRFVAQHLNHCATSVPAVKEYRSYCTVLSRKMAGVHLRVYGESKLPRAPLETATALLSCETSTCCDDGNNSGISYQFNKNYIVLMVHIDQMCTNIPSKQIKKNVSNDATQQFKVERLRKNVSLHANDGALMRR